MPRASAAAKRQHGASNQRDTRHENGLVGPGKRVSKPKGQGQGHLNGNSNKQSQQQQQPSADDAAAVPRTVSPPTSRASGHTKLPVDLSVERRAAEQNLRRASIGTCSSSSSSDSYMSNPVHRNVNMADTHRRIDVNASKNSNVHRDTGPLDLPLTILRSCPLQDTIAILIILMQIPPLALSGVYVLYTLLTFVTSGGFVVNGVFEWNDQFSSLLKVIVCDACAFTCWSCLSSPVNIILLDLAQMVIALGLGGGSSSRYGGSTKNGFICFSMVLFSHFMRHNKIKYSPVGYLLGSSRFTTPDTDDPLETFDLRGHDKVQYEWFSQMRKILAVHILTQGVYNFVHEWLLRRKRIDSLAQASTDPEVGRSHATDNDAGFSTPDSDSNSFQNSSASNAKTKKRQSALIRKRQPLWAALASTKVVVVKEYELTQATAESAGSNATDIHNLGNALFHTQPRQIWISYVGPDEVCFNTSHFPVSSSSRDVRSVSTADIVKPFYVRVNNGIWQPTRITPVEEDQTPSSQGIRWSGDIFGLTPMLDYECEFVCANTHKVLFSTSIRTTQVASADTDGNSNGPNTRPSRLDSPTSILKASISNAGNKLTDLKNRQRTSRKEFSRKMQAMKKENERLLVAVDSAGISDDKHRQRIQQYTTHQKQADLAVIKAEAALRDLEQIPESLRSAWKSKQSEWTKAKTDYDRAMTEYKKFRSSIDDSIKHLEEEKASLQSKRNKTSNRIAKVDSEYARIADANARGLDEVERRRQVRESYETEAVNTEHELCVRINACEVALHNKDQQNREYRAQLESFHTQQAAYAFGPPSVELPQDTAGPYVSPAPGQSQVYGPSNATYDAAAWNNSLYTNSFWGTPALPPSFVPQSARANSASQHPAQVTSKARGRSSSMLSDVSGLTQSSTGEEDWSNSVTATPHLSNSLGYSGLPPPGFGFLSSERRRSDDEMEGSSDTSPSASGGSDGSGSARDPASPLG